MVSVVILTTALSAGILNTHIIGPQDLNEDSYLRTISEYILLNGGIPANWGSNSSAVPEVLGLAKSNSLGRNELDIDKVCRLNSQNAFALTYSNILGAAKLENVALGFSMSQLMDISTILYSKRALVDSTAYTFKISVNQDGAPTATSLHCYAVAKGFLTDMYNSTSADGVGYIDVEIPNTSNGTASLIVFARALHDPRITAYGACLFEHLSAEPLPNNTFLRLSPLNYTLWLSSNSSSITLEKCYAFSYEYQFNLTLTSNTTYNIPTILGKSPIVLIVTGLNASTFFIEWTTYPQIPLEAGADFRNSECHTFSYVVNIRGNLYKLTVRLGGTSQ